ncbi:MAG TPA: hypothetical protein VLA01_03160 [Nitrosopumilaceae archaeon]|nr:hypothetical protein [Nitrosopumilaceae archaeon]
MAKIKLRFGENEIEIESRDFYVDNNTLGDVINSITTHMEENRARLILDEKTSDNHIENENTYQTNLNYLRTIENAEVHEPEFNSPMPIFAEEIKDKIDFLEKKSFFTQPRTVSDTVSELREYGWSASPLLVSKVLVKMAFNKEILKNSQDKRSYYLSKEALLTN